MVNLPPIHEDGRRMRLILIALDVGARCGITTTEPQSSAVVSAERRQLLTESGRSPHIALLPPKAFAQLNPLKQRLFLARLRIPSAYPVGAR
jgi:hypothetical protein